MRMKVTCTGLQYILLTLCLDCDNILDIYSLILTGLVDCDHEEKYHSIFDIDDH